METKLYKLNTIEDRELKYAVIVSRFRGQFVYGRHKDRDTYEIPGGHREINEAINDTAARELMEETGAVKFKIRPVLDYSVKKEDEPKDYGRVFIAEIGEFSDELNYEIIEIEMFDYLPEKLTYPEIQPILLKGVIDNEMERLTENFKKRNITAAYFENLRAAKEEILKLVPREASVGIGHSVTLGKMGITADLMNRGNTVYDKELGKDREECKALKRKALISDWYVTGSNAVSMDGRIINVDHSGNRVAAITYGPDKVIIVVGINKIVDTWKDGIKRVKNIACPQNARRAGFNPPCTELNRCVDCTSSQRVCNSLSIIEGQSSAERMRVFIVKEGLGY